MYHLNQQRRATLLQCKFMNGKDTLLQTQ